MVSAPAPFKAKPLLNPIQILSLMRDDPLLRMERKLLASIPDDFRSSLEAPSNDGVPQFDIRQVNDGAARGYNGDDADGEGGWLGDDDDEDGFGGEGVRGGGMPLLGRLRF